MHNRILFSGVCLPGGGGAVGAKRRTVGLSLVAGWSLVPFVGFVGGDDVMHFAEFGVVMMLAGELQPALLWRLRVPILGLGGLQVAVYNPVVAISFILGSPGKWLWRHGPLIVFNGDRAQTLNEGANQTEGGQSSFSVLLFQDIAVIPMLALLAERRFVGDSSCQWVIFVAAEQHGSAPGCNKPAGDGNGRWHYVGGRFLMRRSSSLPLLGCRNFTATALLVIGIALAMQQVITCTGTFVASRPGG